MTSRCPYNPEHIMPTDAFLNHLRKCKATNKNEFAQCKYDPLHVIRKIVLERHYQGTHHLMQSAQPTPRRTRPAM